MCLDFRGKTICRCEVVVNCRKNIVVTLLFSSYIIWRNTSLRMWRGNAGRTEEIKYIWNIFFVKINGKVTYNSTYMAE
jgi:hypothetical protein